MSVKWSPKQKIILLLKHFVHISALLDPSSSSSSSANSASSKKNADTSGKKGKGSKQSKRKAPDELWNDGNPPERQNALDIHLVEHPPKNSTLSDPSLDVLCLLRWKQSVYFIILIDISFNAWHFFSSVLNVASLYLTFRVHNNNFENSYIWKLSGCPETAISRKSTSRTSSFITSTV